MNLDKLFIIDLITIPLLALHLTDLDLLLKIMASISVIAINYYSFKNKNKK